MKTQSLNGIWHYRVGHGKTVDITVPFSKLPVGHSECEREFDLAECGKRIFLRFDGITYRASVTLNDTPLGELLPYSEYEFEITDLVRKTGNRLLVELEDIAPAFGPTEGWENYGGIIRDVLLVFRDEVWIQDVFFYTNLENDYHDAVFFTKITENGNFPALVTLTLGGKKVYSALQTPGETPAHFLPDVTLWTPDTPVLYTLTVQLLNENRVLDTYECEVGFREITHDEKHFLFNGKPLFLCGVCKHEMYGDSGHTPTLAQTEHDFRMIKDLGCNFVRLVHYPHHKAALKLADRIGLLVSEEPGLWWSDTANPEVASGSIEVLRRTILRDRNHPSVAFWLCFNECRFTEKFLVDSAAVCREYDPSRMVSGANCMNNEDTKKYYDRCHFDFYTMHPYSASFARAAESAKYLAGKPLLFTEWGGRYVQNNPALLTSFIEEMQRLYAFPSSEGALAGAFFWCFAEIREVGRVRHSCIDGILKEGLVDLYRKPTSIFETFRMAWANREALKSPEESYGFTALDTPDGIPLCGEGGMSFREMLEAAHTSLPEGYIVQRPRRMTVGPRLAKEEFSGIYTVPFVAGGEDPVIFRGGVAANCVQVIGLVSAPCGYPISGAYGEEVARMRVVFEDGVSDLFRLRNGMEITSVFTTLGSTRIDPVAENADRFATFHYDLNFEDYVIGKSDFVLSHTGKVARVELEAVSPGYLTLFYGVYCSVKKQPPAVPSL